jgi:spermidine/putrescine transport system ATP-binding protein
VDEIYHKPRTTFVANFIGEANIVQATVVDRSGDSVMLRVGGCIDVRVDAADIPTGATTVTLSVRPEKVRIEKAFPRGENVFEARVDEELFKGAVDQLLLVTDGGLELTAVVANESAAELAVHQGERVWCQLHRDDVVIVAVE